MFDKLKEKARAALESFRTKKKEGKKQPEQSAVPMESAPPKKETKPTVEAKKPTIAQSIFEVSDADKRGADRAAKVFGSFYRFFRGLLIAAVVGVAAGTVAAFFSPLLFALLPAAPQLGVFSVALAAAAISAGFAIIVLLSRRH
jgi:hypothetical protein